MTKRWVSIATALVVFAAIVARVRPSAPNHGRPAGGRPKAARLGKRNSPTRLHPNNAPALDFPGQLVSWVQNNKTIPSHHFTAAMGFGGILIPAFRFGSTFGSVECMLRGDTDAAAGVHLVAPITVDSTTNEYLAKLPPPSMMEPGIYAVRCVRIYDEGVSRAAADTAARWHDCIRSRYRGAQFDGTILEPNIPLQGAPLHCSNISGRVLGLREKQELDSLASRVKHDGCAGVVTDSALMYDTWSRSDHVFDAPPAVVRILGSHKRESDAVSRSALPLCASADFPGRWLPIDSARSLVVNGANIPVSRGKFWVPYSCRTTFWDLAALKGVVARRGGNGAADCGGGDCPQCNLQALRKVVFTGRSVSAVLMAAMREHVFGEDHEVAKRNKDADHLREVSGAPLAETTMDLGEGARLEFVTVGQTMPVTEGRGREEVGAERRQQIVDLVERFQPSALVLHVGLHELCGAYGPAYDQNRLNLGGCTSRNELMETYADYGTEVARRGLGGRTIFRSLMGGFPDVGPAGPWRWAGFVDAGPAYAGSGRAPWSANQCPAILGPVANAIAAGGDAAAAWAPSGVRVVDAFSPFHASPTRASVMSDGLHPNTGSDEALAVNQLIMNALCSMGD